MSPLSLSSPAGAGEGDREAVEGVCAAVQARHCYTPPLRHALRARHLPRNGGGGKRAP